MKFTGILDSIPMETVFGGVGILIAIVLFLLFWQWQRRKKKVLVAPLAPPLKGSDSGVKKKIHSWGQKSVLPLEQELAHINSQLQILPQVEFSPGRTITSLPSKSALSSSSSRKAFPLLSSAPPAVRPLTQQSSLSSPATIFPELSKIEQQLARLNGASLPIPPAPKIPQVKGVLSTPPPVPQADKKIILPRKEALLIPPASLKRKAERKEAERKVPLLPLKIPPPVKWTRRLSGRVASGMSEKKLSFFQRLFTRRPPLEIVSLAKSIVPQAPIAAKRGKVKESVIPPSVVNRISITESLSRETKSKEMKPKKIQKEAPAPVLKKQAVPTPAALTPTPFFKRFLKGTLSLQTTSPETSLKPGSTTKKTSQKAASPEKTPTPPISKPASSKVPLPKSIPSKPVPSAAKVKTPLLGSSEKDQLARLQEGINQLKKRLESA